MSSLCRLSRFSGIIRRSHYCLQRTNVLTYSTRQTVVKTIHTDPKLLSQLTSHQQLLTRCYTVSAEKTVSEASKPQKQDVQFSENFPANAYWKACDYKQELKRRSYDFEALCHDAYGFYSKHREIPPHTFYGLMSLVDKKTSFEPEQMMLLLRLLGSWNNVISREEKIDWMRYLTDKFAAVGAPLTVEYFNVVLNNYLMQWIPFSPVDFLSEMEKHDVTPNGNTLEKFVVAYCRNGDIKSATQVLEHMKTCKFPLTNRGYCALVYGNFIAGDKETAMTLFRDAPNVGFELDAYAYTHAILGNVMTGDLEGTEQMIEEFQKECVVISYSTLCFLLTRCSETNNKEIFDYLLGLLKAESAYFYNELSTNLPIVMKKGTNPEFALDFFTSLSDPFGVSFFKAAILADMPIYQVEQYATRLQARGIRVSSLVDYYGTTISMRRYDKALEVLPHLTAQKAETRPSDLYPLIRYFGVLNDLEGMKSIIPYIHTDPHSIIMLCSELQRMGVTLEQFQQIMKKHSPFEKSQNNACMVYYCYTLQGFEAAVKFANTLGNLDDIVGQHRLGYTLMGYQLEKNLNKDNWRTTFDMLVKFRNMRSMPVPVYIGKLFTLGVDVQDIKTMMIEKGIQLNESSIPEQLRKACTSEELEKIKLSQISYADLIKLPVKKLRELEGIQGRSFIFKLALFNAAYKEENHSLVESTLATIAIANVTDVHMLMKIAQYYASNPDTVEESISTLKLIKSKSGGDNFVYHHSVVSLFQKLCLHGKHADALELLKIGKLRTSGSFNRPKIQFTESPFNMEINEENLTLARDILDTLLDESFSHVVDTRGLVTSYWEFVLQLKDVNLALDELANLQRRLRMKAKYQPVLLPVFCDLINQKDKVALQSAYEKFSELIPEESLMLQLGAAFLECGMKDKAMKVVGTPGFRVPDHAVRIIMEYWIRHKQFELTDDFYKLLDVLPKFNEQDIMFYKLKSMCVRPNPDVDACIQFYESTYEEKNFLHLPAEKMLFAKFLTEQGRPLPSSVQLTPEEKQQRTDRRSAQQKSSKKSAQQKSSKKSAQQKSTENSEQVSKPKTKKKKSKNVIKTTEAINVDKDTDNSVTDNSSELLKDSAVDIAAENSPSEIIIENLTFDTTSDNSTTDQSSETTVDKATVISDIQSTGDKK